MDDDMMMMMKIVVVVVVVVVVMGMVGMTMIKAQNKNPGDHLRKLNFPSLGREKKK